MVSVMAWTNNCGPGTAVNTKARVFTESTAVQLPGGEWGCIAGCGRGRRGCGSWHAGGFVKDHCTGANRHVVGHVHGEGADDGNGDHRSHRCGCSPHCDYTLGNPK